MLLKSAFFSARTIAQSVGAISIGSFQKALASTIGKI
jgi:hypothetical protein